MGTTNGALVNMERGEVTVDIGGTSYTLKNSINAAIKVEALFSAEQGRKVRWAEIIDEVNAGSMVAKRAVFWAMLLTHHPQMTLERAGELSDVMDLQEAQRAMAAAVAAAQPDPQDLAELTAGSGPSTDPRRARASRRKTGAGTGGASTSAPGR